MNCLVVVPTNLNRYSFSGPLAWLFAAHASDVRGVYSEELTPGLVRNAECVVVELNWVTQLKEFLLIIEFIRRHNPAARVLFGGLFAALKYREIFSVADVDCFIRGDNELPMQLFLAGTDPRKIPNLVGRDFENEFSYRFGPADFARLEFNLDWFPSYSRWLAEVAKEPSVELYRQGMPPYYLPMLYSVKSGCLAAHEGCDYCLGSRRDIFRGMYGREALRVDNDQMIAMLKAVERKFRAVTLMIMSEPDYDFRGEHFELEATIEFDSPVSLKQLSRIVPAFREANVHVAVYEEGLAGKSMRRDLQSILELHTERHRYYLFSFNREKKILAGLPPERLLPSEIVLPGFTDYRICSDLQNAFTLSHESFARLGASSVFLSADLVERFKAFLVDQGVPKGARAIIRADTAGFLEVLAAEIGDGLELAETGTGDIRPADLARAAARDAVVIGYNVGVEREALTRSAGARLLLVRPVLCAESEEYGFTRV